MRIAFVHSGQSFMPEVNAYIKYFSSGNIDCVAINQAGLAGIERDVEWFFMGMDRSKKQPGIVRIHEYTSASTAPAARLKDCIKRLSATKPDYRIFLNNFVQNRLGFTDHIPSGCRDMGIPAAWLTAGTPAHNKQFDFIYTGDTSAARKIDTLLTAFTKGDLKNKTVLVISQHYEALQKQFGPYANIIFKGPLPHDEVRDYILAARFALNFIPDTVPYNGQTSTKFLEYAASKIPVISTQYQWVESFKNKYGGNYFYLHPDLSNLSWEAVSRFNYSFPDLQEWIWEKQIEKSGITAFLQSRFSQPGGR